MTTKQQIDRERASAQRHISSALRFLESGDWLCARHDLSDAIRKLDAIFVTLALDSEKTELTEKP